jgi:hypothetical protein
MTRLVHRCPIIIGGFYRSGTSLLRRLLDSHHNIYCGPEVKFFRDFYGNYLQDDLAHLRLFSTIRSTGLDERTLLQVFGKAFVECHELAARRCGKGRWADKNPENVLYLDQWYTLLDGDFIFINVIRNPLDALASLNEAGFKKTIPEDFAEKVALYDAYLEKAFSFIEKHPDLSFTLRYEDLVTNPRETLSGLLSYLGESYDEAMLRDFFSHHRKPGIEDAKVAKTRSIHPYSIGRWKGDLSEEQISECQEHLGSWMTRLEYNDLT